MGTSVYRIIFLNNVVFYEHRSIKYHPFEIYYFFCKIKQSGVAGETGQCNTWKTILKTSIGQLIQEILL